MDTAIIEVNGKRYDAATGVLLESAMSTAPPVRSSGRNIDGFFRSRTSITPRTALPPPIEDTASAPAATAPTIRDFLASHPRPKLQRASAKRAINHTRARTLQAAKSRTIEVSHTVTKSHSLNVSRNGANHTRHHGQQHSQTLRRESVPTPKLTTHNLLQPKSELQHTATSPLAHKPSVISIDPDRLARAVSIPTSPLIAHHGAAPHGLAPTFTPVAVQPVPNPASPPTIPAPTPGDNTPPSPAPAPGLDGRPNDPTDIFEHALANASHFVDVRAQKVRYRQKARVHIAAMTAGTLALVILAGVVAYQNSPGLQVKLASVRSGVGSHLPALGGTGFTYTGVRAQNNRLVFGLLGQGTTQYQLTQSNTNLDSAELADAIGSTYASGAPQYTVIRVGNTPVYRFNDTGATWISGGKWYTLNGVAALTDNQVTTLVQNL